MSDRQPWCALCARCPMCARVCHGVPCKPLHPQLPITCPLYPPAITHHPHYTLQNSQVSCYPLLHTHCTPATNSLTFNDLCPLHTHCKAFFLHLHTHYTAITHPYSLCCTPSGGPLHLLHTLLCTAVARLFRSPYPLSHLVTPPGPVSHPLGLCHTRPPAFTHA